MNEPVLVDLRSDTVTRPGEGMYQAILEAAVGDDVYGEDETVNRLEMVAAQRLGKEAGLFLSSATQANLVAMLVHNARGEEILLGDQYHIYVAEAGGTSALGGIVMDPLPTDESGGLSLEQVLAAIKENFVFGAAFMAEEFLGQNVKDVQGQYAKLLAPVEIAFEPHVEFKTRVPQAVGLIRTGDTTQYGNIILESA